MPTTTAILLPVLPSQGAGNILVIPVVADHPARTAVESGIIRQGLAHLNGLRR